MSRVKIGNRVVGSDSPTYIIGEIGINHNGDIAIAKQLMKIAADHGCDAVKFQKRTPELCVPLEQRELVRETPWGAMSYMDYRHRIEFGFDEYEQIDNHARELGIQWFASCWDEPSVDFISQFQPCCYKIASACLTDSALLRKLLSTNMPLILSTGMSTIEEIDRAVTSLGSSELMIAHTTSTYPCPPSDLNLRVIESLSRRYKRPIGYSGHESGLQTTISAVAMGACFVERHITLDRTMWGTDQAASVEPQGLKRLIRDIRLMEIALGDGHKKVYESELPIMKKLRRV